MPLDLAEMVNAERARATRPLEAPIPGVAPDSIVARVLLRGEPQSWQRPALVNAYITDLEQRALVDTLNTSTDPPSETVLRWVAEHHRKMRTMPGAESRDAEDLIRAMLREDLEARGSKLCDPSMRFGLRSRFFLRDWAAREDLDNLIGVIYEAATGSVMEDDKQIVSSSEDKFMGYPEPYTEAIFYQLGYAEPPASPRRRRSRR